MDSMKQELHKNERILAGCMDRSTSQGLQAVKRIASKLDLDGVYGPLYELFEVDDVYTAAVEVVGGSRYSYDILIRQFIQCCCRYRSNSIKTIGRAES